MQKGDPIEVNFEGLEMQKSNIPMDRVQRVDEKNVIICLVIMFTYGVMVKNGSFFVFSADDSKKLVTVSAKHLSASEIS